MANESDMCLPEEKQEAFVSQVRQGWFELDQSVEVGLRVKKQEEHECDSQLDVLQKLNI